MLAVLPEYFALMGMRETDKVDACEQGDGPIQQFLSQQVECIVCGSSAGSVPIACESPGRIRNTCLVYDSDGNRVGRYDKIHLFGLNMGNESYQEDRTIEPGGEVVVLDTPFGRLGLSICYDLRFPELYRAMHPVDLIVVPAAFHRNNRQSALGYPDSCPCHRKPVLCHRRGPRGYHCNGRETHGNSMIVDPWGQYLIGCPVGQVVIANLDRDYQQRFASRFAGVAASDTLNTPACESQPLIPAIIAQARSVSSSRHRNGSGGCNSCSAACCSGTPTARRRPSRLCLATAAVGVLSYGLLIRIDLQV